MNQRYNPDTKGLRDFRLKCMASGFEPSKGSIFLYLIFAFKHTKESLKRGDVYVTKKPDLDNLIKFVMDALWPDDSKIVHILAVKKYDLNEYTQIRINDYFI